MAIQGRKQKKMEYETNFYGTILVKCKAENNTLMRVGVDKDLYTCQPYKRLVHPRGYTSKGEKLLTVKEPEVMEVEKFVTSKSPNFLLDDITYIVRLRVSGEKIYGLDISIPREKDGEIVCETLTDEERLKLYFNVLKRDSMELGDAALIERLRESEYMDKKLGTRTYQRDEKED